MKKFLLFLFLSLCTLWSGASVVGVLEIGNNTDHSFPYTGISTPAGDSVGDTDNLPGLLGAETTSNEGLLQKLLNAFGLEGYTDEGVPSAIAYLKVIINLLLWLTSFVALVIIIYSFYMMFFQEDGKGMEQVKKNLKGVAIALVIMGLSRIIVSFIFNFYKTRAEGANLKVSASLSTIVSPVLLV